ncbi:MAG: D-2-hydroxyacid dehydrogenase [Spirochaetales bacterium]|nr:D-2-hydroxyacid dehydrogenase [Candidatus Physcosoma equi]
MKEKIVVLDGYALNPGDISWDGFEKLGDLVVFDRTISGKDQIVERIKDARLVITNKTVLDEEVLSCCPQVRYIGVLATGYNVVDLAYCRSHQITVTNIPGYGTDAVAQFAFSMLLQICSHVTEHSNAVKEGRWATSKDFCFWDYPIIELKGKTMGIIGYGRIGQAVGRMAEAMGMKILALSSHNNFQETENVKKATLDEILASSDVISLHCPLTLENKGLINKETIGKMKDGVILINVARGPLVVEEDLRDALNSGKVYAAAVDVVSTEPIKSENPLLSAKNCYITPHIAWAAKESRERLMAIAVDNLASFLEGNPKHTV